MPAAPHPRSDWQLASTTALPSDATSRRLYFFDEALPEGARNVHHVAAPVVKHGIVLDGDVPWETGHVATFCSTLIRLDDGRYRLYYTTVDAASVNIRIAVAESDDGLRWVRRPLGQERWQGHDTNRIVFSGVPGTPEAETRDGELRMPGGEPIALEGRESRQNQVGQPQVLRLPDGSWRMYYWHHQHGWDRVPYLYTIAVSTDGLRWHVPHYDQPALNSHWLGDQSALSPEARLAEKGRRTNDANFVYMNPHTGVYEQYSQWFLEAHPDRRVETDNCPNFNRMIQRRTSRDGHIWSSPELVLQADARDPWDQQFYHLAIQYHEDWLIGSLGHYRVEHAQQSMDLELIFSRDGRRWQRPLRGGFIPRDPAGRDAAGVYSPNAWIDQGDRWLCLYTATARRHNKHDDTKAPPYCIMAASWAKHRFVGLSAGSISGGFMTPVFYPQGPELRLDANIRGWLRAELCDAWGRKRPGCQLQDSVTLHGDDTGHVLRWKDVDTAAFQHDPIRLRFEFADADVYSIAH